MSSSYKKEVLSLLNMIELEIDIDAEVKARTPTSANSMFLINKEQGDWAEEIIYRAINEYSERYCAVRYGNEESLSAGDARFKEYFKSYIDELNEIGKKPDLLLFNKTDIGPGFDLKNDELVKKAIAAIEVRSSSYLVDRYNQHMAEHIRETERQIESIIKSLLNEPYRDLLLEKNPGLFEFLETATPETFKELDFRPPDWRSSESLKSLSALLKQLKKNIKILQKRDYLSITPKLEDLSLVNRWIQHFGVRHYYLQVFFDKAYILSFTDILKLISEPKNEGKYFFVESDAKNQNKTTVKIDIKTGREIIKRIDMPKHKSAMKELDRGRLLYYVTFHGGHGFMDVNVFRDEFLHES